MSRTRLLFVTVAAATSVSLAACSSSSGGQTAGPPASENGSTALGSAPGGSSALGSSAQAASGASTSASASPAALPGSGSGGDFCSKLVYVALSIEKLSEQGVTDRQAYISKLRAAVADAPADIKPDAEAIEHLDEQMINGNMAAAKQLETPAFAAKVQHTISWARVHCPSAMAQISAATAG